MKRVSRFAPCAALLPALWVYPVSADTAKAGREAASLEEVVVTARRREENIQETPIAVTAVSADAMRIAGIEQTEDLSRSIPSLHIQKGQSNQIYIRGIGERTGYARVDPTVGVYLDDLYLPRTDGQLLGILDLQSIQVLRGPQGTLFGKNTTGGAIVMSLAKPQDSFGGYVQASVGDYGASHLKLAVNLPLSDTIHSRVLLNINQNDGYMEDAFTGEHFNSIDQKAVVAQLRWDASDTISLDFLAYAGRVDEKLPATNCHINSDAALLVNGLGLMWPGDTDATNPHAYRDNCEQNSQEQLGDLKVDMGAHPYFDKHLETVLLGATGSWQLGDQLTLKVVAGYRDETKAPALKSDNDGGSENWSEAIQIEDSIGGSQSLELQLAGSLWSERLHFSLGLFAMRETNEEASLLTANLVGIDASSLAQLAAGQSPSTPVANGQPLVGMLLGNPIIISGFDLANETSAAYFQGTYDLTTALQLTAGLRYTVERRESELKIRSSDNAAIEQRLLLSGMFGPGSDGLYPYLGAGWMDDPVRRAQDLFPDGDGDGVPDFPMASGFLQTDERTVTFRELTPMVSLSYLLDESLLQRTPLDTAMFYVTWSNGFKAGFAEPLLTDGLQIVEPETVENREFGFKLDAFDRSLRLNVAIYSMLFENMQLNTVSTDSANNLAVTHQNAGKSEIEGGEMELSWLPLPRFLLSLNYSHNNYRFIEFSEPDLITLALTGDRVPVDRSDETFPLSPQESASLSAQYDIDTALGVFTPRIDASYKSAVFNGLDRGSWLVNNEHQALASTPSYYLYDARLAWQNSEGDLSITAFVKNLTDERHVFGTSVADSLGTFNQITAEPRTWGLQLYKTF